MFVKRLIYSLILMSPVVSSCSSQTGPLLTELQPGIYQVNDQYFYREAVRTYLIDLDDRLLLFDIPEYSDVFQDSIYRFSEINLHNFPSCFLTGNFEP